MSTRGRHSVFLKKKRLKKFGRQTRNFASEGCGKALMIAVLTEDTHQPFVLLTLSN